MFGVLGSCVGMARIGTGIFLYFWCGSVYSFYVWCIVCMWCWCDIQYLFLGFIGRNRGLIRILVNVGVGVVRFALGLLVIAGICRSDRCVWVYAG